MTLKTLAWLALTTAAAPSSQPAAPSPSAGAPAGPSVAAGRSPAASENAERAADETIAQLADAVARARRRDAPGEIVIALEELAVVEFQHGRLEAAQAHFEEALRLSRARGLDGVLPGLLSNIGMVLHARGQDARALEQYQQALALCTSANDTAKTLGNLANLHLTAGRLADAEAAYTRALAAFDEAGNTAGSTATAVNLGMVLMGEGRYDAARKALEAGLARARSEGLTPVTAAALLHLARVHEATGLFDKAESAYQESLELFRAADNPQSTAAALAGLGGLYLSWGRNDRALALAEQALALAESRQIPDQILASLELLANVERLGGRFNTAILHDERALGIAMGLDRDTDKGRVESSLGAAFLCWRKPGEAEKHFRAALAIAERLGFAHATAQAWIHLGAVQQISGDATAARESYSKGLELARAAGAKPDEATVLNDLGTLALGAGRRREAEGYFLQSIALEEAFRLTSKDDDRPSALVPWLASYRWLVLLHFLDGDASGVFDAAERIKARRLAERISSRGERPTPAPVGIEGFRRDLPPSVAIVSFVNVDWQYPLAVFATRDEIQAYALAVDAPKASGEAQAATDAVLQPNVMPRDSTLGRLLVQYRDLLSLRTPSASERRSRDALARRLFTVLLGPVEGRLASAEELVVIPDGSLSLVPFETLRLPDGRALVERHHVTYAPSLRVLQLLRQRGRVHHDRPLLAMGGAPYGGGAPHEEAAPTMTDASSRRLPTQPDVSAQQWEALRAAARRRLVTGQGAAEVYAALGRGSWSDLPGAREEVEAIGRLIPGSMVLSGDDVSEAKLKALSRAGVLRQFRTLHFATHGLTIAEAPELSALVLAEAGRAASAGAEDGYLSAEEIAGLDLQADFVNLSACESGLGRIYGGEGAVGLTQAFLEAGANGVSVSLWQVHDAFTRDFMVGLYRRVREQGQSPARALTAMKRALLRQGKVSPALWAPFVYYGSD